MEGEGGRSAGTEDRISRFLDEARKFFQDVL